MSRLFALLFPARYRYLPASRLLNVSLRSLHILGFSVFTGGYWFGQPNSELAPWLWLAMVSGGLMVLIELYGSFSFVVELRGLAVFLKLGLLALVPVAGERGLWLLATVIVLASVTSHMRGKYRHLSIVSTDTIERLAGRTAI